MAERKKIGTAVYTAALKRIGTAIFKAESQHR